MSNFIDQISSVLKSSANHESQLPAALQGMLVELNSETATVHRLDPTNQVLQLVAQIGLPPALLDIVKTIPVGKGIAGQTVARGGPVTICNLQTDNSGVAKPGARQTGVGGGLSVPIRKAGTIVGSLGIGTKREHEYTAAETVKLEGVANLLGELGLI